MAEKINVEQLIKNIHKHKFFLTTENTVEDDLQTQLQNCNRDYFYYIGTSRFINSYFDKNSDEEWKIRCVFQLGYPYSFPYGGLWKGIPNHEYKENPEKLKIRDLIKFEQWFLVVFTKNKVDSVIIGFNNSDVFAFKDWAGYEEFDHDCGFKNWDMAGDPGYHPDWGWTYKDYIKDIKKIIEKDRLIERRKEFQNVIDIDYEFNEVPYDAFYPDFLYVPYRYKKSVINDFGIPSVSEDVNNFKDVVDIIPAINGKQEAKKDDLIFDFMFIDPIKQILCTRIRIAEKDINNLKAGTVIRPKNISSYYLKAFLESEFVKDYCLSHYYAPRNRNCIEDSEAVEIDIDLLPVILTEESQSNFFKKKLEMKKEKSLIERKLKNSYVANFFDEDAKKIILRDIKELKTCFNSGTYKAAIILAGSVLEAFLIDWLSEIDDRNYFDEDYMIYDKYRNRYRRADLKDYISSIAELKKPSWFDAAQKATEIRKKRNLVHAKLYINDSDISRETCTEVINYLEYVINTRWK